MSFYIFLYIIVILSLLYIGIISYPKYKSSTSWKYFLLWVVGFSLWLFFYFLAFTITSNDNNLMLSLSRILYGLSFVSVYCMVLFFSFYGKNKKTLATKNINLFAFFIFAWVIFTSVFSGLFITSMYYDPSLKLHYEQFGPWFSFLQVAYFINPIILFFVILKRYKKLYWVDRIRYLYIAVWYMIFLLNYVFFLGILPTIGIWIFQKEQVVFFIPFILLFIYTFYRYRFTNIQIWLGRVFLSIFSLVAAVAIVKYLKWYLLQVTPQIIDFWGISQWYSVMEVLLSILLFFWIYSFLSRRFLIGKGTLDFTSLASNLREQIPFIQDISQLNSFLTHQFQSKLWINTAYIVPQNSLSDYSELESFFNKKWKHDFFIHDYVFIQENKNKFDKEKILTELDRDIMMYFPLYNNNRVLVWLFCIGKKTFWDIYTSEEIDILKNLSWFLQWHLKYIRIYSQIYDLNLTLDKRVDEKTIKYNNLINTQKEFIGYIVHEVSNPLTNAIFLSDQMQQDLQVESHTYSQETFSKDVSLLSDELLKLKRLTHRIFSVEKHDLGKVKLYTTDKSISTFLENEAGFFQEKNRNIDFSIDIEDIGIKKFDTVQLRQVIQNLISNAIKFTDNRNPQIHISLKENTWGWFIFCIEDNGRWFDHTLPNIFDKYTTWKSSWIWLGLWLYLCKRIVELHGRSIEASISPWLWGARFCIICKEN